jgi:hypothetical protein
LEGQLIEVGQGDVLGLAQVPAPQSPVVVLFVGIPVQLLPAAFWTNGITQVDGLRSERPRHIINLHNPKSKFLFEPGKPGRTVEGDKLILLEFKGAGLKGTA